MKKNRIATLAIALGLIAAIAPGYAAVVPTGTTTESADLGETSGALDRSEDKPASAADFNETSVELDVEYCRSREAFTTLLETCVDRERALRYKPVIRQILELMGNMNIAR